MNEIDLIPRSYRDMIRLRRILRASLMALSAVCLIGVGLIAMLRWQLHVEASALSSARRDAVSASALLAQVRALSEQKTRLDTTQRALAALRGGDAIVSTAAAIDAALNPGVWLTSFSYTRDREAPDAAQAAARGGGSGSNTTSSTTAARPTSGSIELKGGALDHRALSDFMKALSVQPGTANVRFIQSGTGGEAGKEAVEFSASAALLPARKDER